MTYEIDNTERHANDDSAMFHFSTDIADTVQKRYRNFCIHIFCTAGRAKVRLSEKEFTLEKNECFVVISNATLAWLETSPDFEMHSIAIDNSYMSASPETKYFTHGMLSLIENPILKLSDDQFKLCFEVCAAIKMRLKQYDHLFYKGLLRRCVDMLILDIYNIRAKENQNDDAQSISHARGNKPMRQFQQFIAMLERGDYKQQREVRWYAEQLGISPKYLSEVSMDSSGHGASYWINKFTTEEIVRLLQNPAMTVNAIGAVLNFKTRSYFSHYVKEHIGKTPKEYRMNLMGLEQRETAKSE